MKINFKHYESLSLILEKILCFTQDLYGGAIPFGWVINPNTRHDPNKLSHFIDNLFCYGQDYSDLHLYQTEIIKHRAQRLKAIRNITILLKVIYACKDEIKQTNCHSDDDALKMLI